jgi:hypothetical protein
MLRAVKRVCQLSPPGQAAVPVLKMGQQISVRLRYRARAASLITSACSPLTASARMPCTVVASHLPARLLASNLTLQDH